LKADIDVSSKQADLEKRRKEEIKKVEKLCKKEQNEVENADQGKTPEERVARLKERIKKSILEMQKVQKKTAKMGPNGVIAEETKKIEGELQNQVKKCGVLKNLCNSMLEKNFELYLKHEEVMAQEREKRQELSEQFN